VLVLIDGQRMPWTMRAPDLELIPAPLIQRIEVVEGPCSSLYGSDAEAGVINIITRSPTPNFVGEMLLSGGSFDTYSGNVFNSYMVGPVGWVINFNREQSDGWIDRFANRPLVAIGEGVVDTINVLNNPGHPYETNDLFGKLTFRLSPVLSLRAKSDYHWEDNYFTDQDDGAVRDDKVRVSGLFGIDLQYGRLSASLTGTYFHRYFRYREFSTNYVENPMPPPDLLRSTVNKGNNTEGDDFGAELVVSGALADWNLLTGGLSYRHEMLNYSAFEQSVMTGDNQSYDAFQTIVSAFAQDEIFLFRNRWSLVPGVRVDYHEVWGAVVNPKFSTLVRATDSTALRAGIGRAFLEPTLSQLYRPVFRHTGYYMRGNEDLRPETAIGWNAEIEQTFGQYARATAGYFQYELYDMIWTTIVNEDFQGGLPLMTYTNLKRARTYGLESSLELFGGRYTRAMLNYTWTRTLDLDEGGALGTVPEHSAAAQFFVDYDPWGVGGFVGAVYETERQYIGMGGRWYTAGSRWLTNARVYKTLGRHVELALRVNNWLGYWWDREGDGDNDLPPTSYFGELKLSY
jgi:outer membrane receptor for ferrienterochelin and colicins